MFICAIWHLCYYNITNQYHNTSEKVIFINKIAPAGQVLLPGRRHILFLHNRHGRYSVVTEKRYVFFAYYLAGNGYRYCGRTTYRRRGTHSTLDKRKRDNFTARKNRLSDRHNKAWRRNLKEERSRRSICVFPHRTHKRIKFFISRFCGYHHNNIFGVGIFALKA